ncbi:branched-chain amino acid transport system II carrier protein [Microbacteriaceae bacterium 4G12]
MNNTLKSREVVAVGLMLFALFLGAGNLIFPPLLGQQAGKNVWIAIAGFLITGVGLPLLAVTAIANVQGDLKALSSRVHPTFGVFFPILSYVAIGPLFGIPRTGTVGFEMGMKPFLSDKLATEWYMLLFYTILYFGVTWYLSINPSQLIDWFGKWITPLLVVVVCVIVGKAIISPVGKAAEPMTGYDTGAFFKGFIQGYLTMDAIGALVLGIVVVQAIRAKGVTEKKQIAKTTIMAGAIAAVGLILIYISLAFVGSTSIALGKSENGGTILTAVVNELFGPTGKVLLAFVITFACLTTSVGLTSACAEFFSKMFSISYKKIVTIICVFSLFVSNLGLTQLIQVTLPVLIAIYPIAIVLILLSFVKKVKSSVYMGAVIGSFAVSLCNALESVGVKLGALSDLLQALPLYTSGIGWLLPAIVGGVIGLVMPSSQKPSPSYVQKKGA